MIISENKPMSEILGFLKNAEKIVLVGCNIVDELKELVDDYIEIDEVGYSENNEVFLALQQLIFS